MTKETIALQHIAADLKITANLRFYNIQTWRFSFIIPLSLVALIDGLFIKSFWLCIPVAVIALYHMVRYLIAVHQYRARKKAIADAILRHEISVSVEKVSHIAEETVYEPHPGLRRSRATKQVHMLYFESGGSFRIPELEMHYPWSKEYYISTRGLMNITCAGDAFYLVSPARHCEIAYVYPCKFFVLDPGLEQRQDGQKRG